LEAAQTVEGVRNAEGGRRRVWKPVVTMLLTDVAKRDGNSMEGALSRERWGRHGMGGL